MRQWRWGSLDTHLFIELIRNIELLREPAHGPAEAPPRVPGAPRDALFPPPPPWLLEHRLSGGGGGPSEITAFIFWQAFTLDGDRVGPTGLAGRQGQLHRRLPVILEAGAQELGAGLPEPGVRLPTHSCLCSVTVSPRGRPAPHKLSL